MKVFLMKNQPCRAFCTSILVMVFLSFSCSGEEIPEAVRAQLSQFTVKALDYRSASISDIVADLQGHFLSLSGTRVRIELAFEPDPDSAAETETRITLLRRNISILDAVHAVAKEGEMEIRFGDRSVALVSSNPHDEPAASSTRLEAGPVSGGKRIEWNASCSPLEMRVEVTALSGEESSLGAPIKIPDTYPLMLLIQMRPTPAFRRYRRRLLSEIHDQQADQRQANAPAAVSYAMREGADPFTVVVQRHNGHTWESHDFAGGRWILQGLGDLNQIHATRLRILHTSLFPRRLARGQYRITVRCALDVRDGEDIQPKECRQTVLIEVGKGRAASEDESCATSWLQFMLEATGRKSDPELREHLDGKFDEWLQAWVKFKGVDIHHARTVGLLAAQLNKLEIAYSYLLEYLLYSADENRTSYKAARYLFTRVCVELRRENPLAGTEERIPLLEDRTP